MVSDSNDQAQETTMDTKNIILDSSSLGSTSLNQVKYKYDRKSQSTDDPTETSTSTSDDLQVEALMAQMKSM